ncbi:MAG TPA: Uma2 family endonuclease, partial [Pyrinomonadaceae bacterium]|nr:Uma2 family endonuclease [Pyrinomonadaceae bacterium]
MLERSSQLIPTPLMTAEELMKLPHGEGLQYELIDGELQTMPTAGFPHGRVANRIATPLSQFIWDHELGEVFTGDIGFQLSYDPDTVLAPDVSFFLKERLEQIGDPKG